MSTFVHVIYRVTLLLELKHLQFDQDDSVHLFSSSLLLPYLQLLLWAWSYAECPKHLDPMSGWTTNVGSLG